MQVRLALPLALPLPLAPVSSFLALAFLRLAPLARISSLAISLPPHAHPMHIPARPSPAPSLVLPVRHHRHAQVPQDREQGAHAYMHTRNSFPPSSCHADFTFIKYLSLSTYKSLTTYP